LLISTGVFIISRARSPFVLCIRLIFLAISLRVYIHSVSSFWFTYALIIIFLGGIIVVFSYASSINRGFKLNLKWYKIKDIIFIIFIVSPLRLGALSFIKILTKAPTSLNYSSTSRPVIVISAGLLLIALFIVVKLVQIEEGPLKL
jgi:hypothetical protein